MEIGGQKLLRIRKMISDVEWTLPNQSSIFQNTVEGQTAFIVPDQTGGCVRVGSVTQQIEEYLACK